MRWLVTQPGPAFSVQDVYAGWVEALKAQGQQVATYNLDARLTLYDKAFVEVKPGMFRKALNREQATQLATNGLLSACYQWWPDVVLIVFGAFVDPDMLDLIRERGHKVVLLHTEEPYEHQRQLALSEHASLSLVNDPTNLGAFQAQGPAAYMPHAYRPDVHYPGSASPELKCDLGFVGTGYESRVQFFEAMDLDGLDVLLAGNWARLAEDSPLRPFVAHDPEECLDNARTAAVYRSARAGLNLYRREGDQGETAGWAMGPREVELAATECFFLRDPRPEGDEVLHMLPTFGSPEEASERLRWWLAHDQQRERAAAKAREAVADRTFDANAKKLLSLIAS